MAIITGLKDSIHYGHYPETYTRAENLGSQALVVKSLTVSIIVHGDFSYIEAALTTLFEVTSVPVIVYVTINRGDQESIQRLQQNFPQAHYLINDESQSFAYNHNQVMRLAQTDVVALLNDDITITSGMVDQIVAYMNAHPEVGLATPRIVNSDGTPQLTAFNDPTILRMLYRISGLGHFTRHGGWARRIIGRLGLSHHLHLASLDDCTDTRFVPVAVGVAMFVRRIAYEQAGMMDEATRIYGEELAWHWRLRRAGWRIAIVGDAVIVHHNAAPDFEGWKLTEHRKGILNYFIRYRPRWQAALIRAGIIGFHSLRWAAMAIVDRDRSKAEWQTVRMALTWKPAQTEHTQTADQG